MKYVIAVIEWCNPSRLENLKQEFLAYSLFFHTINFSYMLLDAVKIIKAEKAIVLK